MTEIHAEIYEMGEPLSRACRLRIICGLALTAWAVVVVIAVAALEITDRLL